MADIYYLRYGRQLSGSVIAEMLNVFWRSHERWGR